MKTIYKYQFPVNDEVTIALPKFCRIIKWSAKNNVVFFWAIVDTDEPLYNQKFIIKGTGHDLTTKYPCDYLDTVFDGPFVWHIFKVT